MNHKFNVCGFENLHVHSTFSSLDGAGFPEQYAEQAVNNNQKFLCITDHGQMSVIPRQVKACEVKNLSPLFGCELYYQPNHPASKNLEQFKENTKDLNQEEKKLLNKSYHLLAIAYTNQGYSNLVRLCSWSHIQGFYRKPRINYEQLIKYKEGIIFTSCCYMGEIGQTFDKFGPEEAFEKIKEYHQLFGDNFYLEIMLLDFEKQKPYNKFIIDAHDKLKIPIITTNDCHYRKKEDSKYQRYMLMIQTGRTIKDIQEALKQDETADLFELQDESLWYKSEDELNEKWLRDYSKDIPLEIFEESKRNTVKVCERAKNVTLDRSIKLPKLDNEEERFKEELAKGFRDRGFTQHDMIYAKRLEEEYELICRKGFASYFLIQKQFTDEARRIFKPIYGWGNGDAALSPGRGSSVSSLACYCLRITDIDPIKHGLLFSRFLSEGRGGKQLKLKFPE